MAMKKIVFILAVMLVINQNVFSKDAERKFTIQASPLLWFTDILSVEVDDTMFAMDLEGQLKLTNYVNLSLTSSFLFNNHRITEDYERNIFYRENVYQVNFKPMFIFRPFGTGLMGFYLGFYPNVGFLRVENKYKNQFYTEYGLGMNLGYKWVFRNGFTMQLGGGFGRTFSSPEGSRQYLSLNSDGRLSISHTDIHLLDFKLGYSF